MDDAQIVERVKVEMFAADRGDASEEDVARAAIAAHKAALAEAGMVIVPREPTPEMIAAGEAADWVGEVEGRAGLSIVPDIVPEYVYDDATGYLSGLGEIHRPGIWRAMIAAVPDRR